MDAKGSIQKNIAYARYKYIHTKAVQSYTFAGQTTIRTKGAV